MDEDVPDAVRVSGNEVGRVARERNEASARGDMDEGAVAVPLEALGIDAHAPGDAGLAVVDEHVDHLIQVRDDQVVREAQEGHVSAVRGDRGPGARPVSLGSGAVDAHHLGGAVEEVTDEDVGGPFVSPGTRFFAALSNATNRPSPDTQADLLGP